MALNAGFTCPNMDGTVAFGGCSYCSAKGSGDFAGDPCASIKEQYLSGLAAMRRKWENAKGIAYFQARTNTYAPLHTLQSVYAQALALPDLAGISIATRADCLPDEVLELLSAINEKTFLTVELGLQTIFDQTAQRIGRGHDYQAFLTGYAALKERGIKVCVHIIDGLPGETPQMMSETAAALAKLSPDFLKIHLLHVLKGTRLAAEYEAGAFQTLSMEEYISIVCNQLELLPPQVVLQRLTGDAPQKELIAPLWSRNKKQVLNGIDRELIRRDSWQGKRWKE